MKTLKLKNKWKDKNTYIKRIKYCILFSFLCFCLLIINLFFLQITHYSKYKQLSDNNQTNIDILPPIRGNILDRNNKKLAYQTFSYNLIINNKKKTKQEILDLANMLNLSTETTTLFLKQNNQSTYKTLKYNLTSEDIVKLSVQLFKYPNTIITPIPTRIYPYKELLAHTLGYVGQPTEGDIINNPELSRTNSLIGKNGIEKYYNTLLTGIPGYKKIQTNALGQTIQNIHNYPAIPGNTVQLTIDINLQQAVDLALGDDHGVVIVTKPNTGEILALTSHPSYNLNDFINPTPSSKYKKLFTHPHSPLFNRALKGQYPPGSTIKPLISLFALRDHFTTPEKKYFDKGWFQLKGSRYKYRDWKRAGHGWMTLSDAITESCSTFFYHLAYKIGINHLSHYYEQFGFNQQVLQDLPEERTGLIPSRAWKEEKFHQQWYIGETLIAGIGQGYVTVTPIQLANMITMISNRGQYIPLHIIKSIKTHQQKSITLPQLTQATLQKKSVYFSNDIWDLVLQAMHHVTSKPKGTAYQYFHNAPYDVAGKTGTAQVSSSKTKSQNIQVKKHLQDNSLFIGFSPVNKPEITITVLIENAHGAAAMAKKIFDFYYSNKEIANESLAYT